ncbi:MAG: hypothetical protein QXI59_03520 [Candidatus Bathyarchaeia archaeon]
MHSSPELHLNHDEERCWKDIQRFRFSHPSPEGQVIGLFWRKAVEAFAKGDFICSIILAGVTSELAHKTRLHEQGAKIKRPNGRPKSWKKLIDQYGKSDEIKLLTEKSKMTIEIFGFISATTNLNCFYREKASQ